ncbi:MAG TPA: DUF4126 domain-containing protein [Longimicrobiales bacterium]
MSFVELATRPDIIAASLLLIISAAGGISLYATLGALGLGSRLGLIDPLPPGLSGLENGLVIGTAAILLAVEAAADREHAFAGMWHTLHALVKPLAAALLAASALAGRPAGTVALACLLAGFTALLFHAMRYGGRVAVRLPGPPRGGLLPTLVEAVTAVALLVAVRYQEAAPPTALGLLLVASVGGPLGYRAFRLGIAAQRARMRNFLGEAGWSGPADLPRSLRSLVPDTALGGTPPRATRIGVLRAPGLGRFTRAWLVVAPEGNRLLGRSVAGRRVVEVPRDNGVALTPGAWADRIDVTGAAGKLQILLLKDGPAPALVARALAEEPLPERRVETSNP